METCRRCVKSKVWRNYRSFNMGKERIHYLDLMRITACFLVVMTHSVMSNYPENGRWLGMMSFICSPSSEMFLMLSGAILMPVKVDMMSFYKRRFIKLLPPMFIWSCFGVGLHYYLAKISLSEAIEKFLLIPFKPVIGVYWFLYVMIGLYLFAPIISMWLQSATKRQIEIFLVIWLFNMAIPWLNLFIPDFYDQDGSYYWMFCNFGGFLGYWILGYYLKRYPPQLFSFIGIGSIIMSISYFTIIVYLKQRNIDTRAYTDNLQIGSVFLICVMFIILKAISDSSLGKYINDWASSIAQYSFGIYLLHIYVIRDFIWNFMSHHRMYSHPVVETLAISLSCMILCTLIIKTLSKIYTPFGKWMFGIK